MPCFLNLQSDCQTESVNTNKYDAAMVTILMLETVGLLVKPAPNARNIRLINKVRGSRIMPPINKLKFLVSHVITVAPYGPHNGQIYVG